MTVKKCYNTVWVAEHPDPNTWIEYVGQPIQANEKVLITHCATRHQLASDTYKYVNDFGSEREVNCHSYATKNKSQNLALESSGSIGSDASTKFQQSQNLWTFYTAPDPSWDYQIEAKKVSPEQMLAEIKAKLLKRGHYGIRGVARQFRILDDDGNR